MPSAAMRSMFGVGQGVGEDAEEGAVGGLAVKPFQRTAVDEVGGVLCTLFIAGAVHWMSDVGGENFASDSGVAVPAAVGVQEVGIVKVCLELADVAVEFVDAEPSYPPAHFPNIPVV